MRLSYRELDARSEALASRLRAALPAGDEPVVGVALPRSAETVVALLAILKAQAVYLPLDIAYPLPRLQHLLDDARAVLLIDEPGSATAELAARRLAAGALRGRLARRKPLPIAPSAWPTSSTPPARPASPSRWA